MTITFFIHNLKNKKSYGHDYLSNILLKRAQATLVKPLTFLINQTLTTGIFPRELKISRVKPLFKKGDPMLFSNYRPISLLSSISKIYEYVIFHQLLNYMDTTKNCFIMINMDLDLDIQLNLLQLGLSLTL